MNRIGNYDIIGEKRLMVPEQEADGVWVDFQNEKERFQLHLFFEKSDATPSIKILGKEDHSEITLINWSDTLGTCTTAPLKVGVTNDNRSMYILIASSKISSMNMVDVQFMLGW